MSTTTLLEDKRPIGSVWFDETGEGGGWRVGSVGVTKIEAYAEPGEYGPKPYLAVYKGNAIHIRVPASMVYVVYED